MTIRGVGQQRNDLPRSGETWVWSYNLNLIGEDKLPNRSTERPNPVIPAPIDQTWIQRHVQFTGKDTLPSNQDDWPNSQSVQWYRDWSQSFALTHQVVQKPLNQYDWPNQGQPYQRLDQTWLQSYRLTGQDKLPNRQQDWTNPSPVQWSLGWTQNLAINSTVASYISRNPLFSNPRLSEFDISLRSWNQGVATSSGTPFNNQDWSNPTRVSWYQDWNNTLVLNMPVFMPSFVTGWDIPPSYTWYQNWQVNLLQTTLAAPPAPLPKNPNDWPNPTQPSKLDQFWAWNQTRYQGQDRLPNRQQDWPTPYPVQWYQDYKVNLLQTTLFTTPALPNIRQYDWPLPRAYEPLVPSWTYTSQFIVPAPIPPVTIGGQYTEEDADALTEAYARAMEFALKLRQGTPLSINEAAAALAKRGGDARAKSLSPSQRTKIASNAASIRWKK